MCVYIYMEETPYIFAYAKNISKGICKKLEKSNCLLRMSLTFLPTYPFEISTMCMYYFFILKTGICKSYLTLFDFTAKRIVIYVFPGGQISLSANGSGILAQKRKNL